METKVKVDVLLPCPWCGKVPKVSEFAFGGHPFFGIRCCYADIGRKWPKEVAIEAWNKRQMTSAGDVALSALRSSQGGREGDEGEGK